MQLEDTEVLVFKLNQTIAQTPNHAAISAIVNDLSNAEQKAVIELWLMYLLDQKWAELAETFKLARMIFQREQNKQLGQSIQVKYLDQLVKFVQSQHKLEETVLLMDTLYQGCNNPAFTASPNFFQCIVTHFEYCPNEEVAHTSTQIRLIATENLVKIMLADPRLIQHANQPYYFMEFWLHLTNAETDRTRKILHFKTIQQIYNQPQSRELLNEIDFMALVDILLRNVESSTDEEELSQYLKSYLMMAINDQMRQANKIYRRSDLMLALQDMDFNCEGIADLVASVQQLE